MENRKQRKEGMGECGEKSKHGKKTKDGIKLPRRK